MLIGELAEIDAKRLRHALAATFAQRARRPLPNAMPSPPSWARPYAVLAREVGVAVDIEAGHAAAARSLLVLVAKVFESGRGGVVPRA